MSIVEYSDASTDMMLSAPRQAVLLAGSAAFGSTDRMEARKIARIWATVDRASHDGCWRWSGSMHRLGYGRVYWQGRSQYAHRVIYELVKGQVPEGLDLDHLCRNRGCVNPDHLEPVTHRENCRRSPAIMARGVLCKVGHVLDYASPNGRQGCRTCRYEAVKRWRDRKSAAERHGIAITEEAA